jgi:aminoglycoside N3'-acetyltransferase
VTRDDLRSDLVSIGVEPGITLVVHSSLSSIGRVVGGAPTVVSALLDVIGDNGTLAMPAATPQCADPASWSEAQGEFVIGVGFNRCTALHFAESLVARRRLTKVRFPRSESGRHVWVMRDLVDFSRAYFEQVL